MLHTRNNNIKSLKLFSSLFFALSRCIRSLIHVRSVISVIDLPADIFSKNSKQIFIRNTRLCNSTNEKKTRWLSRISLLHVCRPSETWHRVKKKPKNIWCKIFARRTNCRSMPRTCSTFILLVHCRLYEVLKQTATANLCVNISSASSSPVRAMGLGKCAWKCVGAIKGNIFVLFVQHT